MRDAAVDCRDLVLTYVREAGPVRVLRGASLDARRGEIVLLRGPSGAGKTTLLSVIAGMLAPTSGSVVVDGSEVTSLRPAERTRLRLQRMGFVFQAFNLIAALSARENVELVLRARGASAQEARKRAEAALARLGLGGKEIRRPAQLSGGEQQRVAIARAFAGEPALILADEPTSSLDARHGALVVELLCELARERGTTVLVASHDERIVPFADRIVPIEDGRCT